ncbi:hypothetical protein D3C81_1612390 [compost metagenome]
MFAHRSICASVWLANELDITKLGWPVAQPRLTRRPSASRKIALPFGKMYLSTCGLMLTCFTPGKATSASTWISLSKWPMLQTMAWSFIALRCSMRMMSLLPVVVTYRSARPRVDSMVLTSKPSIAACRAQIGSISVTTTRAP